MARYAKPKQFTELYSDLEGTKYGKYPIRQVGVTVFERLDRYITVSRKWIAAGEKLFLTTGHYKPELTGVWIEY
ncbi:hypothetical protein SBDP1_230042 [Syntrophobacter sp. SbD1]|nr:hypothetical protein SBDP1_230042 [Syntrophobacter sp. SbD1]